MANPARDKGTKAESGVVRYLQSTYWPYAERRSLNGALDKGDITGTPGLCWEVKSAAVIQWWGWIQEAVIEAANCNGAMEILVVKPPRVGFTDVGGWYAAMSIPTFRWIKEGAEVYVTEPTLYRQVSFPGLLRAVDLERSMSANRPPYCAVTLYKPGMREDPASYIRVTYLRQMVNLLRDYGYGSSNEQLVPAEVKT